MERLTLMSPTGTQHIGLLRAKKYKGIYSRVARQLKVAPSVVRRVAVGLDTSERIMRALIQECSRIERHIEKIAKENVA
jgi:hypothetical protein